MKPVIERHVPLGGGCLIFADGPYLVEPRGGKVQNIPGMALAKGRLGLG